MFIYGRNSAIERLKSNEKIIKAYILEGKGNQRLRNIIEKLKEKNIPITYEKKHFLNKLVEDQSHQGVVLEIPDFQYSSLDDLFNISKEEAEDYGITIDDFCSIKSFNEALSHKKISDWIFNQYKNHGRNLVESDKILATKKVQLKTKLALFICFKFINTRFFN